MIGSGHIVIAFLVILAAVFFLMGIGSTEVFHWIHQHLSIGWK